MTRWVFLRHGESEANASRVFSGHHDVALTQKGLKQAEAAGPHLTQILGRASLQRAFSSDLQRARTTAEIVLKTQPTAPVLEITPVLRERHLGQWQGRSIDELKATGDRQVLLTWNGKAPGGESLSEVAHRALPFLVEVTGAGPFLLVGHGGLIRVLLGLIDEVPFTEIGRNNIANAEPIVRDLKTDQWSTMLASLAG